MMVIFQNRVIYMPGELVCSLIISSSRRNAIRYANLCHCFTLAGVPLNSRQEKLQDYAALFVKVPWREDKIETSDGEWLSCVIGEVEATADSSKNTKRKRRRVVIVYLQGYFSILGIFLSCIKANIYRCDEKGMHHRHHHESHSYPRS